MIITMAAPVASCAALEHFEDLGLDRDVEGGRRLVGDDHVGVVGDRHRDHHPLAHAAGELVREAAGPLVGVRDADEVEQLDGALRRRRRGSTSLWTRTASAIWSPTV